MKEGSWITKSGRLVIRYRYATLAIILLLTAFFGYQATKVELKTPTIDLFPKDHEYVQTYVEYEEVFGGANVCLIALTVEQGDVFNTETFAKIRDFTKALELLPAVNNYQVLSIAQRKIKKTYLEESEGLAHHKSEPIMWPNIPKTAEEIAQVKHDIYTTGRLHGTLVSLDDKAALIAAGFLDFGLVNPAESLRQIMQRVAEVEERDPEESLRNLQAAIEGQPFTLDDTLYGAILKIAQSVEDDNTKVHMIGRPILLGVVEKNFNQLYWIFFLTIASIIFVLFLYFRDLRGVLVPVVTMLISACWGLGILGLIGSHFNPLVIVVPFVISARALSHSVQLIERFMEEYRNRRDRSEAAVATYAGLFKPGMLSIITDAAGVFIVILTPIPLMEKLAIMGGFWVLSIIVSDMIFNPVVLSILPPPSLESLEKTGWQDRLLAKVGEITQSRARVPILIGTAVVFFVGLFFARNLVIGDVHPGTPLLWPDSVYNQDTSAVGDKFGNTESLSIILEGIGKNAIKNPKVLRVAEGLQRHLEELDEVHSTSSIADLLPEITRIMHSDNPKWELIPEDPREAGLYLEILFSGVEPGDLARYITNDFKDGNIAVNLRDHKGETLRAVVAAAKEYIANNPMIDENYEPDEMEKERIAKQGGNPKEVARFRLAGNYGGLLAAINEAIVRSEAKVTILAFTIVFVMCLFAYRSALAGVLFMIPIALSNYLTYALMGALGIGLDVNTLPVVALGVGLGVDYGLYVVGRLEEEFIKSGGDWGVATARSISTAGKAVLFTATTMVAGIIFWMFSFLRFQAEMGILLAFWMIISMIGGLLLLPILVYMIKPNFIAKSLHRGPTVGA
ncbi:MAG: MMPL family transporter [Candidatus Lernaella stagnicola]|nr:MMPL family transporter [Candidatus Lernaella stagnicola]